MKIDDEIKKYQIMIESIQKKLNKKRQKGAIKELNPSDSEEEGENIY